MFFKVDVSDNLDSSWYDLISIFNMILHLGGLRAHKRLMHSKDNLKACPECSKQFLNTAALNNHIAVVHRGERNHICSVCGRTYAYRKHLIRHIKVSLTISIKFSLFLHLKCFKMSKLLQI